MRRREITTPLRSPWRADTTATNEADVFAEYSRARDPRLLEELVVRFTPLARSLASRYRGGREPFEDLLQVANCGLVNAITRFDPHRGRRFAAFAKPTILGELRRHFRDHGWAPHVSRSIKDLSVRVERAADELTAKLGRAPSPREIAAKLEVSEEDALEALEARQAQYVRSTDPPEPDDDAGPDRKLERALGERDRALEAVEDRQAIEAGLARLSARDRRVVLLRFGADLKQSEIAARVGVSQMQVSRIVRSALARIRREIETGAR